MALTKAVTKYIRISPRKARLAAGLIRRRPATQALLDLKHSPLRASRLMIRTLKSAIANAENNCGADRDQLLVEEVRVDEGPTLKRAKARNKGGRSPILKRTSHFTICLAEEKKKERRK